MQKLIFKIESIGNIFNRLKIYIFQHVLLIFCKTEIEFLLIYICFIFMPWKGFQPRSRQHSLLELGKRLPRALDQHRPIMLLNFCQKLFFYILQLMFNRKNFRNKFSHLADCLNRNLACSCYKKVTATPKMFNLVLSKRVFMYIFVVGT